MDKVLIDYFFSSIGIEVHHLDSIADTPENDNYIKLCLEKMKDDRVNRVCYQALVLLGRFKNESVNPEEYPFYTFKGIRYWYPNFVDKSIIDVMYGEKADVKMLLNLSEKNRPFIELMIIQSMKIRLGFLKKPGDRLFEYDHSPFDWYFFHQTKPSLCEEELTTIRKLNKILPNELVYRLCVKAEKFMINDDDIDRMGWGQLYIVALCGWATHPENKLISKATSMLSDFYMDIFFKRFVSNASSKYLFVGIDENAISQEYAEIAIIINSKEPVSFFGDYVNWYYYNDFGDLCGLKHEHRKLSTIRTPSSDPGLSKRHTINSDMILIDVDDKKTDGMLKKYDLLLFLYRLFVSNNGQKRSEYNTHNIFSARDSYESLKMLFTFPMEKLKSSATVSQLYKVLQRNTSEKVEIESSVNITPLQKSGQTKVDECFNNLYEYVREHYLYFGKMEPFNTNIEYRHYDEIMNVISDTKCILYDEDYIEIAKKVITIGGNEACKNYVSYLINYLLGNLSRKAIYSQSSYATDENIPDVSIDDFNELCETYSGTSEPIANLCWIGHFVNTKPVINECVHHIMKIVNKLPISKKDDCFSKLKNYAKRNKKFFGKLEPFQPNFDYKHYDEIMKVISDPECILLNKDYIEIAKKTIGLDTSTNRECQNFVKYLINGLLVNLSRKTIHDLGSKISTKYVTGFKAHYASKDEFFQLCELYSEQSKLIKDVCFIGRYVDNQLIINECVYYIKLVIYEFDLRVYTSCFSDIKRYTDSSRNYFGQLTPYSSHIEYRRYDEIMKVISDPNDILYDKEYLSIARGLIDTGGYKECQNYVSYFINGLLVNLSRKVIHSLCPHPIDKGGVPVVSKKEFMEICKRCGKSSPTIGNLCWIGAFVNNPEITNECAYHINKLAEKYKPPIIELAENCKPPIIELAEKYKLGKYDENWKNPVDTTQIKGLKDFFGTGQAEIIDQIAKLPVNNDNECISIANYYISKVFFQTIDRYILSNEGASIEKIKNLDIDFYREKSDNQNVRKLSVDVFTKIQDAVNKFKTALNLHDVKHNNFVKAVEIIKELDENSRTYPKESYYYIVNMKEIGVKLQEISSLLAGLKICQTVPSVLKDIRTLKIPDDVQVMEKAMDILSMMSKKVKRNLHTTEADFAENMIISLLLKNGGMKGITSEKDIVKILYTSAGWVIKQGMPLTYEKFIEDYNSKFKCPLSGVLPWECAQDAITASNKEFFESSRKLCDIIGITDILKTELIASIGGTEDSRLPRIIQEFLFCKNKQKIDELTKKPKDDSKNDKKKKFEFTKAFSFLDKKHYYLGQETLVNIYESLGVPKDKKLKEYVRTYCSVELSKNKSTLYHSYAKARGIGIEYDIIDAITCFETDKEKKTQLFNVVCEDIDLNTQYMLGFYIEHLGKKYDEKLLHFLAKYAMNNNQYVLLISLMSAGIKPHYDGTNPDIKSIISKTNLTNFENPGGFSNSTGSFENKEYNLLKRTILSVSGKMLDAEIIKEHDQLYDTIKDYVEAVVNKSTILGSVFGMFVASRDKELWNNIPSQTIAKIIAFDPTYSKMTQEDAVIDFYKSFSNVKSKYILDNDIMNTKSYACMREDREITPIMKRLWNMILNGPGSHDFVEYLLRFKNLPYIKKILDVDGSIFDRIDKYKLPKKIVFKKFSSNEIIDYLMYTSKKHKKHEINITDIIANPKLITHVYGLFNEMSGKEPQNESDATLIAKDPNFQILLKRFACREFLKNGIKLGDPAANERVGIASKYPRFLMSCYYNLAVAYYEGLSPKKTLEIAAYLDEQFLEIVGVVDTVSASELKFNKPSDIFFDYRSIISSKSPYHAWMMQHFLIPKPPSGFGSYDGKWKWDTNVSLEMNVTLFKFSAVQCYRNFVLELKNPRLVGPRKYQSSESRPPTKKISPLKPLSKVIIESPNPIGFGFKTLPQTWTKK